MSGLKRVIMHWTAGTHKANASDRKHYHVIIEGDGRVVLGDMPPEANLSTSDGRYVAHTRGLNTGSIGVAVAAMHMARERPFYAGRHPITRAQVDALVREVASLCDTYGIPVTPQNVLTHAEVQGTLGVAQRGKWDITWLPSFDRVHSPSFIGELLRDRIMAEMDRLGDPPPSHQVPTKFPPSPFTALFALLARIFGIRQ